ncbi:hypothetical protein BT69DRAFT_18152 [Atractiella rhizophila]|nr:hypothetical protein BT69DRAFT_18152 [Atractiella rhizophila]
MTVIESIKNFVHRDHHQKHGHSASSSPKNQPKAPPQPNPESQQPQVVPKSIPVSQAELPVDDFKALDIKEPKSQPHNPESSMSQSKRDLNRKYAGELPEGIVLEEKMGDGAFSNVYKAWDDKLNIKVALKCVRKFELNQVQVSLFLWKKIGIERFPLFLAHCVANSDFVFIFLLSVTCLSIRPRSTSHGNDVRTL